VDLELRLLCHLLFPKSSSNYCFCVLQFDFEAFYVFVAAAYFKIQSLEARNEQDLQSKKWCLQVMETRLLEEVHYIICELCKNITGFILVQLDSEIQFAY